MYNRLMDIARENTLKGEVADILAYNLYGESDDEVQATFDDLMQHGCVSGMISGMIYYHETEKFFDRFEQDVQEKLVEYGYDRGEKYDQFLAIEYMNENDATYEKNWFAWFLFEAVAYEIASELGI